MGTFDSSGAFMPLKVRQIITCLILIRGAGYTQLVYSETIILQSHHLAHMAVWVEIQYLKVQYDC